MLGSIVNEDGDIEVFFEDEEIEKLESETLEGEIIEFKNPQNQNKLCVSIDTDPDYDKSRFRIHVDFGENYHVYIHPDFYSELSERGWTGTRDGYIKVDLITESFAKKDREFSLDLKLIKSRYENRDKLKGMKTID